MSAPRTVLIGVGMVADLHVRAARLGGHLDLVGLLDADEARGQQRSSEWSIPAYASLERVLGDPDVQAVCVLTPPETHVGLAASALEAGKHVLVEKPVASVEGIETLERLAQANGLVCMPGHNYAYQPEFVRLRTLVREESLGRIRALFIHYVIRHPEDVARHYAGVLDEVMVHHAYLTVAVLGLPTAITAGCSESQWQQHPGEDQAWMTWEYPNGLSVHHFATFAVDDDTTTPWMFMVKVLGTHGGATYNWRDATYRRPLGTLSIAVPAYEDSYIQEHAAFASAIAGNTDAIVSTLSDAGLTQRLMSMARESASKGSRMVTPATWSSGPDGDVGPS